MARWMIKEDIKNGDSVLYGSDGVEIERTRQGDSNFLQMLLTALDRFEPLCRGTALVQFSDWTDEGAKCWIIDSYDFS